jgi:hypothetical protein
VYRRVLFSNMRVEQFVCELRRGAWVVTEHERELHPRAGREPPII